MEFTIECQTRAPGSKPNALRREGRMPAVLYGHEGVESMALTVDAKSADILVRKASLNNTLIQVTVPDKSWTGKALLREVQTHPWRNEIYHLSFFAVAGHGDLTITVPLNFVGEAVGVKQNGGALDTVLNELEVQCAADRIPESIEIDVSDLNVGDIINVSDLKLPQGVAAVGESDRVVATVLQSRTAQEPSGEESAVSAEVAKAMEALGNQ